MNPLEHSPLGARSEYPQHYDAGLLYPIARAAGRAELGIDGDALPFLGVDVWNAYEISWLDARGKPQVALGEFRLPAHSPYLVESKSFKLYLNGFNQERIGSIQALQTILERDLSAAVAAPVTATLVPAATAAATQGIHSLAGQCIDTLDIECDDYGPPQAEHLRCGDGQVEETLVSHLLKSNCPVTGQPDWASVQIGYTGKPIEHAGLLRYLVSFRTHAGFHEQCVERIYIDLWRRCSPCRLSVYARYTRRGGLDINPWRSSHAGQPDNRRDVRQ